MWHWRPTNRMQQTKRSNVSKKKTPTTFLGICFETARLSFLFRASAVCFVQTLVQGAYRGSNSSGTVCVCVGCELEKPFGYNPARPLFGVDQKPTTFHFGQREILNVTVRPAMEQTWALCYTDSPRYAGSSKALSFFAEKHTHRNPTSRLWREQRGNTISPYRKHYCMQ